MALETYRKTSALNQNLDIKDYSCRNVYRTLLPTILEPLVASRRHPNINFAETWKTITNRFSFPLAIDLNWRIAHGILPVNALLKEYHINNDKCPLCDEKETHQRLFYYFEYVRPIWKRVEKVMEKICDTPQLKLKSTWALFGQNPGFSKEWDRIIGQIISGEVKSSVWHLRNRVKYEKKRSSR